VYQNARRREATRILGKHAHHGARTVDCLACLPLGSNFECSSGQRKAKATGCELPCSTTARPRAKISSTKLTLRTRAGVNIGGSWYGKVTCGEKGTDKKRACVALLGEAS